MPQTLTVNIAKAITSANILNDYNAEASGAASVTNGTTNPTANGEQPQAQSQSFSQLCRTLEGLITKLNAFYDKVFAEHKEEIAGLSVEIARKVLVQKVQDGDYEIESIIKEALQIAPTQQDVVVHLNTKDLTEYQKTQANAGGELSGIKFISDANIGPAECRLESPKGIIESLISEHLEKIGKALAKAE